MAACSAVAGKWRDSTRDEKNERQETGEETRKFNVLAGAVLLFYISPGLACLFTGRPPLQGTAAGQQDGAQQPFKLNAVLACALSLSQAREEYDEMPDEDQSKAETQVRRLPAQLVNGRETQLPAETIYIGSDSISSTSLGSLSAL
ncbi:hypothetical protein H112_03463 [Trichophyton rubrum D6]|uniref:Uncharacterized protein n=2 Tax=Trichophyton TaxID=5550 RepID=A0A022W5Q4_TRIRU|nr:hypothetical protein H100_03468 [Trichophyton rubrum MR850]EZF42995.1 hypothetical protein H102_03463 [Trichophyton rubrum CBS 100081]EZF53594.1 hypothetical protein H103_03472 [Trichophyton rubrum CBS 288.86]EZF64262.1 hypothetical protein H104_03457 [Trichophyton rubrum CBS 289.86]EZF74800.1 hypothetical protein H105_03484 [Trichophyton soudanense CBS 452.61]EZF85558.1 hypothetical protein H110_03469 [Trichophyton rubrum MR1448]EZF96285.1 hypothetical protein H113_03484 [Trichophyton rub